MKLIERYVMRPSRRTIRITLLAISLVLLVLIFGGNGTETAPESTAAKPQVHLITPIEYAGGQSLSLIGTVRAFSEAEITAEKAGRVTSVPVSLGQTVRAGQVVATVENASEQAAVLQAEGVYEAALAAARQSDVSLTEAQNDLRSAQNAAVTTFQSAYNTGNGIVRDNIDDFFSDPDARVPGLRIDGRGFTAELNAERVAYQTLLNEWQGMANTIAPTANLVNELEYAKQQVQRTISFLDTFLTVFAQQNSGSRYSDAELQSFITGFTAERTTLIGQQSGIDGALAGLAAAKERVNRAELGASGGTTSAADAQVKQALGALRAAEANLAKTIFRTPISGTVNAISVRTGDFVNSFAPVAIVANNAALEIVTYVSDTERNLLSEGDVVMIENEYEGRVTSIAPAVSSETGKIEVRIATEGQDIVNGDTVRISKTITTDNTALERVQVPLSAVKFAVDSGSIFVVSEGRLVAREVELGVVRGGSVAVLSGLAADEQFVKDARGLMAGTEVEVAE